MSKEDSELTQMPVRRRGQRVEFTDPNQKAHLTGQNSAYMVLTEEERAKGWQRPYRDSYVHVGKGYLVKDNFLVKTGESGCGTRTTMSRALAETYARDPGFYTATYCTGCGKHFPVGEFFWDGTVEPVGS